MLSPPMGPLEGSPMTVYMARPSDVPPSVQRQLSRQSSYAKLSNSASGKVLNTYIQNQSESRNLTRSVAEGRLDDFFLNDASLITIQ